MRTRSLTDCLNADSGMSRLSGQANRLLKLQRIFDATVPEALAPYARVANIKPGRVVIHAENGAVAAKLRQLAPRLAEVFRKEGVDLSEIQVKVQPSAAKSVTGPAGAGASIGEAAKQGLTSLAQKLPEGSPLKAALGRFVERAKLRTTKR